MARNEELFSAISKGDRKRVSDVVRKAIEDKVNVADLLNESMIPAMREMGEKFSRCEIYVPDMLVAARAMQTGLDLIEPLLSDTQYKPRARVCVGTVDGDLHDIGKNLVAIMLKGAGFEVDDLGVSCPVEKYEEAVARGSTIVCLSALLTTTMPYMKTVVDHFKGRDDVRIIIGGAPITQRYADQIGAHGYGADANEAVTAIERILASA